MFTKKHIVKHILCNKPAYPHKEEGHAFAPSNIALVKYWGKRDDELNLPLTSSFSVTLAHKGSETFLSLHSGETDDIVLNDKKVDLTHPFATKIIQYLDLFREKNSLRFHVNTRSNIPIGAGLASSACGFAALVLALNQLFSWELTNQELSILARLGSGSACRSIFPGFVYWEKGLREDGMDSFGNVCEPTWPNLCIGLCIISALEKPLSSREAMVITKNTSFLYRVWPDKVTKDLVKIKSAIDEKDFTLFGETAENNALTMHATMMASHPPIIYSQPKTLEMMHLIWKLRHQGLPLYFTQDAGPNLKLLFLKEHLHDVLTFFPEIEVIQPFLE